MRAGLCFSKFTRPNRFIVFSFVSFLTRIPGKSLRNVLPFNLFIYSLEYTRDLVISSSAPIPNATEWQFLIDLYFDSRSEVEETDLTTRSEWIPPKVLMHASLGLSQEKMAAFWTKCRGIFRPRGEAVTGGWWTLNTNNLHNLCQIFFEYKCEWFWWGM